MSTGPGSILMRFRNSCLSCKPESLTERRNTESVFRLSPYLLIALAVIIIFVEKYTDTPDTTR